MIIKHIKTWRQAIVIAREYPEYRFTFKGKKGDYTLKGTIK